MCEWYVQSGTGGASGTHQVEYLRLFVSGGVFVWRGNCALFCTLIAHSCFSMELMCGWYGHGISRATYLFFWLLLCSLIDCGCCRCMTGIVRTPVQCALLHCTFVRAASFFV